LEIGGVRAIAGDCLGAAKRIAAALPLRAGWDAVFFGSACCAAVR
jgi:hypothetical protein